MYKRGDIVTHLATEDVKVLVDFGALCHRKGERGMTALHFAASHDDVAIAKTLVTAGCPLNVVDKDVSIVVVCENQYRVFITIFHGNIYRAIMSFTWPI